MKKDKKSSSKKKVSQTVKSVEEMKGRLEKQYAFLLDFEKRVTKIRQDAADASGAASEVCRAMLLVMDPQCPEIQSMGNVLSALHRARLDANSGHFTKVLQDTKKDLEEAAAHLNKFFELSTTKRSRKR